MHSLGTLHVAPLTEQPVVDIHPVDLPPAVPPRQIPLFDVNIKRLTAKGILAPKSLLTRANDEYRRIKQPFLINAFGKGALPPVEKGKLIMISSSLPGEGKTHTTINLAFSMAQERNHRVLLIDADIIKCDLSRQLGLKDRPGLTDLILDENTELEDYIIPTTIPNLSILPCGRSFEDIAEILSSDKMRSLLEQLVNLYPDRINIFDSAPLLPTVEAQILSTLMGQIGIVVEAARTPQDAVLQAVEKLDPGKVLGLILNKGSKSLDSYYYGNYYGYRA